MNQIKDEIVAELMELGYTKADILKSIDDVNIRLIWNINSLCLIYSQSKSQWCNGEIIDMFTNQKTNKEWLTVKYNKKSNKNIQRFCKDIKPIHFHFDDDYKYNNKIIQFILGKLRETQMEEFASGDHEAAELTKSRQDKESSQTLSKLTGHMSTATTTANLSLDGLSGVQVSKQDLFAGVEEKELDGKSTSEMTALAAEYKAELELQRETMVKWKAKIQDLSKEIVSIEQERSIADQEYKGKMLKLKQEIAQLDQTASNQKATIDKKELTIRKTQGDIQEMVSAINVLKRQSSERRGKLQSIQAILAKVPGDAVSKLKYGKESKKFMVYTNRINHLFYYDAPAEETAASPKADAGKAGQGAKFIVVRDISINHPAIGQQMNGKPWFLLIGDQRTCLLVADSIAARDKWVNFVKRSLGQRTDEDASKLSSLAAGANRHGRAFSAFSPSASPRPNQAPRAVGGSVNHGNSQKTAPFGQQQSPINIVSNIATSKGQTRLMGDKEWRANPLTFNYPQKVSGCTILNNGHTVQVNIGEENKCTVNIHGKTFTLRQFHFHTPSEHTIDSRQYEMELHLVHTNENDEIAVLGFIFTTKQRYQKATLKLSKSRAHLVLAAAKKRRAKGQGVQLNEAGDEESDDMETDEEWEGDEHKANGGKNGNDFLAQFWDQLPAAKTSQDIPLKTPISFDYLFECSSKKLTKDVASGNVEIDMQIFEYTGSLTTPPYTEGVNWMVSKQTHFINNKQLHKLSACWGHENNARPVQGYFGRQVAQRQHCCLHVARVHDH